MTLTQIEASFFRYLYEKLEVVAGIKVLDDINLRDFSGMTKWVVVDTLPNKLGDQPKQLWFLHIATQKQGARAKEALTAMVDTVASVVNAGEVITVYDFPGVTTVDLEEVETTAYTELGSMEISETSLSPVMPHASGGIFRSMTVGVVYAA